MDLMILTAGLAKFGALVQKLTTYLMRALLR
jgi:hypothetical protein